MKKEIVIATKNKGKVREFEELFSSKGISIRSLLDYPDIEDIEENGNSFAENAGIKAETISAKFQTTVIADDSGLVVDALDGRPGIYSARYAGEEKDDWKNLQKVLQELEQVPDECRKAKFHCALAVAFTDKQTVIVEGTCEGIITREPIGDNGFGYDPIMYIPQLNKTMAQLTSEEKNVISHRKAALIKLEKNWQQIFS